MNKYRITVLRRYKVDVAITEGAAGGGIKADTDGGQGIELFESLEQNSIVDVGMQVSDVERRRRGRNPRFQRH